MDSLSIPQKTKSRKMKKIAKKPRVHIIFDMFSRAIEIIAVVVTVAKLSYQLVLAFEDSGVAAAIIANRNLAFAVGNAIVIALIVKSGLLVNQEHDQKRKRNDFYDEFVMESSRRERTSRAETRNVEKQSEVESEARQSISETEREKQSKPKKVTEQSIVTQSKPTKVTEQSVMKQSVVEGEEITVEKMENSTEKRQSQSYRRCWSEKVEGVEKSSRGRLRRSETDASSERFDSDDELRYKIESFIARQRRNQNDD